MPKRNLNSRKGTKNMPSSTALNKWIYSLDHGDDTAKERIVNFINSNYEEANRRLSTLREAGYDYYSPTVSASTFLQSFDLGQYTPYDTTGDLDYNELKAASRTMQRFLSSPLSELKNAKKYAKSRIDYAFDPNGNLNLNERLPNATTRQKNYVARILADSALYSQLFDVWGTTDEIAEELAADYSYQETYSKNIRELRERIAKEIEFADTYARTLAPTDISLRSK